MAFCLVNSMIFLITKPGLILKSNTLKINIIVKDVKFEKKSDFKSYLEEY